jgi:protein phosphatase
MKVASMTDPGRVRQTNEDSFFADGEMGLLMVADGMGGHAGGAVASGVAVATISELVRARQEGCAGQAAAADLIRSAMREADMKIRAKAAANPALLNMGTTVVMALCVGTSVHLAHAGDSRAYLIHNGAFYNGSIERLTEDHSLVAQMVKDGELTAEEAPRYPLRNVITRSLGNQPFVEPEVRTISWRKGDCLLLCSDGLTNMVKDSELRALIAAGGADVEASCREAIDLANRNGGRDNLTAVLAYCD